MRGTNPAWLIPVVHDIQVPAACLSRRLIRQPAEPVVAFVSEWVSKNAIRQLAAVFDQVIFSPGGPPSVNLEEKDVLLLQSLKLSSFSTVVILEAGALVGWSFDQALEKGCVKNQEGDWILVSVSPNPNKYLEVVSELNSGKSFNTQLINDIIALDGDGNEVGFSWPTLKYYNGLRMPLVSLTPKDVSILQQVCRNEDHTTTGFWQKVVLSELAPLIKSDAEMSDWSEEQHRKIAIIGMSCRFPGANSVDEYWQVLSSGLNTASAPPSHRLGKCELTKVMKANFLKCPIDEFDASFFEIPPSTAAATDPQARLLLEVSWEAFEDAAINPEKLRAAAVGVFYGSWLQEYRDMVNLEEKPEKDFFKKYSGCGFGGAAAKVSFFYGFTGPNIATESSCCSSITAVQLACENLLNGQCPLALAAGANVILQMDHHQKVIWATDGICRSFDTQGNGYGRGEGIGVLVLKRYDDAIRDGDRIQGIILGSGTSQEGLTTSFATPTVENETRTMRNALLAAKVRPTDVDYVEAHATGTGVGDPIEAEAIVKAYSSPIQRQTPLLVGSVKTNIGHAESCSGIASIVKVLLALKHETIPPHINVKTINPKVDFSPIPAKITLKSEPWKRSSARRRIAGVSNFGISGADAHLIIQEAPPESVKSSSSELPFHILTLSAKTDVALEQLTHSFLNWLETAKETLVDITFTANACRAHLLPFRSAFVALTREELIHRLRNQLPSSPVPQWKHNVCFICHDLVDDNDFESYILLYSHFPAFQISMDVCDSICKEITNFSPVTYLINNKKTSSSTCWEKEYRKICTFSVTYSLHKLWESWGVKPSIVFGLNFGELVGAAIAGELELAQCFQLIMNGDVKKGVRNDRKTNIPYISAKKGVYDLNSEHWKEICGKKNETESQLASSTSATIDCDVFITLDLQGKVELGTGRENVLRLPKPTQGNGLGCLFTSLATLYTNGFPIDWEGFYAHQCCKKVTLPHYPFQRKPFWFRKGNSVSKSPSEIKPGQWNNNIVHPLLGCYVPSEGETFTTHNFENLLITKQQAPYLAAHVIGTELIFPAAAHLELLIAAGSFQGDGRSSMIVNNFDILQPLHLVANCGKLLRTTMKQTETGWNIRVESSQTAGENWKQYASGDLNSGEQCHLPKPNLEELKRRLVANESASSLFYERIAKVGLNFGTEFKSLKNIQETNDEILAQAYIPEDAVHCICHPLLADAMIQCFLFEKGADLTVLNVPVGIKKFACYRRLRPAECSGKSAFIYYNKKEQTVVLLDSKGIPIASMTELELKATTVGSVLLAAGCPSKNSKQGELDVWQVCWKPTTKYQSEGMVTLGLDFTKSPSFISLLRSLERRNVFTKTERQLINRVDMLCELFVYKAFHELSWKPKLNETFLVSQLAAECHIAPNFLNTFHYFLSYFENSGCITITGKRNTATCKVLRLPETREVVENSIAQLTQVLEDYEPLQSVIACASLLAPVMQGKAKGQRILFEPGEGGVTPADKCYKSAFYKISRKAGPHIFFEIAAQLWHNGEELGQGRKLRILEVGGGTGVFTSEAISLLNEDGIEYNYHFTDLSSHFFKKAEGRFPHLIYKILDLERDPLEQGFPPAYFDIVVGLDVLHATKNLKRSVGHLQMLLRTGGQLLLGETSKPIKEIDVTFGILDGYWHFEDHHVRHTHCTISADHWLDLLQECGFRGPNCKLLLAENHHCVVAGTLSHRLQHVDKNNQKTWLLVHDMGKNEGWVESVRKRMLECGRNLISHEIRGNWTFAEGVNLEGILCFFQGADSLASNNCRSILEPLLLASKFMIKKGSWNNSVPRLCVATLGLWMETERQTSPSTAPLWGFVRTARMEIPWLTTKLVDLDPDVDLEIGMNALVQEIWMEDDETEVVYRGGVRFARRLININPEAKPLVEVPNEEGKRDYTVELPKSNLLQDIQYVPKQIENLNSNEVIVEVRAAALNFRDVFSVLKPSERFKDLDTIGMDFSGVISSVGSNVADLKIGTPVFGVCFEKSTISGYISTTIGNLARMPDKVTFSEAATLPVAFLTAWHCLVDVAHASSGQTILIHAASGGVGLVAIQIAKHFGLNIVATAGSQRKRTFLRNLGIQHVYNSRTLEFGQKINEVTNDQGVDIVLNCLTGPGFKETSLEVCKKGGHFVEISKLDIWEEHQVKARKPGINYKIVDLSVAEPNLVARLLPHLSKSLGDGSLKPLPYTRFTASRIVSALQFLQKAKQIGKVIVEMPYFDLEQNIFKNLLFNDRSTYLITGGKGAIGLAIAEWMVSHRAKYLVLLGRHPPQEKALELIQQLETDAGAKIVSVEGDVADFDEMNRVLQAIQDDPNLPPLRGIHHCAGVLSDDMVVNQDWANFDYSLNPKVKGSYNLHLLTIQAPLEFFVVHSSLTCVLGNHGQTNHTSGSLYTEALMESRVRNGFPGMSISWGHWDAGLAENREVETLDAFTIAQGIYALEKFFLENRTAGGAGFINIPKLRKIFPAYEKTLLESIALQAEPNTVDKDWEQTEENKVRLPELYKELDGDDQQQQEMIRQFVKKTLCYTLGLPLQELGGGVNFSKLGLDSLMSIEFYNILQTEMGSIELGYIDMEQQGTVDEISKIIKTALDKDLG